MTRSLVESGKNGVLERVIESWLDSASERSFQGPFCCMLCAEGYAVVHLTRHCGMEMGKDVIAIAPDGTPCAYQLKAAPNGRVSLRQWRSEISSQVDDLVLGKIVHPSIQGRKHHRSYLVTNGILDEEVIRAVDDRNRTWRDTGQSHLHLKTIVRGELLAKARALQTGLWPSELAAVRTFLELFLTPGNEPLPKKQFASLLEQSLFRPDARKKRASAAQYRRALASTALLCAIGTSSFSRSGNYAAEVEAWTMYSAYVLALASRWRLPKRLWLRELEIARLHVYNCLNDLFEEVGGRKVLTEGSVLGDQFFIASRRTLLAALTSVLGLWRLHDQKEQSEIDASIREFCLSTRGKLEVWGEAAIPQFLAIFWYLRKIDPTASPDGLLRDLISFICESNRPGSQHALPNPYYGLTEVLPHRLGISEKAMDESFGGTSYTLESLVHLYVRRNWKQTMKLLWPRITYVGMVRFRPRRKWQFFRWMNRDGVLETREPTHSKDWGELVSEARESKGECVPELARQFPIFLLLFLIVFPHRVNAGIVRWLDGQLGIY